MSISFPLVRPETVPVSRLFWLSVAIPCGALLFGHGLQALRTRSTLKVLVVSFAWAALGLLQGLAIVFTFVNTLKLLAGRQRPNFFGESIGMIR